MRPIPTSVKQYYFITILFLLCLFCPWQAISQTYMIPDMNFRNCLKATYPQIFNASGELIIEQAKTITRIECQGKNIQSLEGIGYFVNVDFLDCANNQIEFLPDLTTLTRLQSLGCSGNKIFSLPDLSFNTELTDVTLSTNLLSDFPDISHNLKLRVLQFHNNSIQNLPDLSAHTMLTELDVSSNPLQSLPDLSANTALVHLNIHGTGLPVFPDLSQNINLETVSFGSNPQLPGFPDLSSNLKLTFIACELNNLTSIPDLSALTELQFLICNGNNLTSLPDLSKNPELRILRCHDNDIVQLPDLSKCPRLEWLYCEDNKLTTLPDLSNSSNLLILKCSGNNLTSLPDLTKTRIGTASGSVLETFSNQLTFEDLITAASLPTFATLNYAPQKKFSGNSSRTFLPGTQATIDLDIDDAITSNVYTWYKDNVLIGTTNSNVFTINMVTASDEGNYRATVTNPGVPGLVLESGITTVYVDAALQMIPDANFRACLRETYPQIFNSNGELILSEAKKIKVINCSERGIESIEGIGYFEIAETLNFDSNKLQQVASINGLGKLRTLSFENNQLTASPDLSGNPLLQVLDLGNNKITVFPDLTHNPNVGDIQLGSNEITSVPDLSACAQLSNLHVGGNPLLSLPDLSVNTWLWSLEISSTKLTAFPDLSRNTYLSMLSFGGNPQFNVFPDLSANKKLTAIECSLNNLTVIPDLSIFPDLQYFSCYGNNLSALPDLSLNPNLKGLHCDDNDLIQLPDLSKCLLLETLDCSGNKLTSLPDLSNNTNLATVYCQDNKLTSLPDLSRTKLGKAANSSLITGNNHLTFKDLVSMAGLPSYYFLEYAPQAKIGADASRTLATGAPFTIDLDIDDNVASNIYTWYKNDVAIATTNSNVFTINIVKASDAGSYKATVRNPGAPDLVLESGIITVNIDPALQKIPDDNFRACLRATYPQIFDIDGRLILSEAKKIKVIDCSGKGIESIEGIGYFEGAESLTFNSNKLQQIADITGLSKLNRLSCLGNQLTTAPNLSGNPLLQYLELGSNKLTTFPDLTHNPALESVSMMTNQITSIPALSGLPGLRILSVGNNPLRSLGDLSANTSLNALEISNTELPAFPDLSNNVNLFDIWFQSNPQFGAFPDLSANTRLISINCSFNNLTFIPDLGAFTNLQSFDCYENNLTELPDFSKNTQLKYLQCGENNLTQLPDLSQCLLLEFLDCRANPITSLPDLSNNTQLATIYCFDNKLTSLPDLSRTQIGRVVGSHLGTNGNQFTFEDLLPVVTLPGYGYLMYAPQEKISADASQTLQAGASFTIDLNIDDNVTSNIYTWYKDDVKIGTTSTNVFTIAHVTASDAGAYRVTVTNPGAPDLTLESGITTLTIDGAFGWIADDNFRACLKETYPWVFNSQDQVILAEAATIRDITCAEKGIKDISGIEYFTNTETVYLHRNQITDISMLPALTKVYRLTFDENKISALPDMSASPYLQELHFYQNNFSTFPDATANTNMKVIDFRKNHITSVPDLSAYQNLISFSIGFNPITALPDLNGLPMLSSVDFAGTNLSTFPDLSGVERLGSINFGHNPQFSTWPANFPLADFSNIQCDSNNLVAIPSLSAFPNLGYLNVAGNELTELPGLSSLTKLFALLCNDNKLTALEGFSSTRLQALIADNNNLQSLPDLSNTRLGSPAFTNLLILAGNRLTMEDLLPAIKGKTFDTLSYAPQTVAGVDQVITKDKGESFTLDINIDDAVTNNIYTWYRDGMQIATTSTNTLTINSVQAEHAGVYTCVITNPDLPKLAITWQKVTLKVNTLVPPWTPVAGGAGNHIVVIPASLAVDLYGTAIQPGDYIGIFFKDDNAGLKLSGSVQWNGAGTAITVWAKSDQAPKNGFNAGEEMTVMVWKASEQKSYTMSATYDAQVPYTDQGNFRTNGFSKMLSLTAAPVCQRISLYNGWNLISSYVMANDISMASIFANRAGVIVKDASGRILYAPEFGITSGTWNIAEGYLIYSAAVQSFEICGRPVDPVTPISLVKYAYPSFLPYYGDVEIPVSEGLQALGTNYSYAQTIVYNGGAPQAYNYIPAHVINPPIDQIGYMKPGLAYKILLQNSVPAFSYPARISTSVTGRLRSDSTVIAGVHYGIVKPATVNNAVLVIPDEIFGSTLSRGDELGVFSSTGELIGTVAYHGAPMAVTLWEPANPAADNRFTVRLWRAENGQELPVALSYAGGAEGKLIPNTLLVANMAHVGQSEEFGAPVKVFPNPASENVQFSIHTTRAGAVRIVLYDMMGRERGTLFNDTLPAGEHHQTVDLGAFSSGQYIYKVSADNRITSDKLVIVK
ncbi:leucine-rich repeat domain-containing protein [Fulvivirgaceae bacterium PWU4]|uniref:Leucine-rich repeat domain-containing protein n=1 Tax=Chryseosolibacter histidini TaxID=2782349 RepID=A0AAP2DPK1_9BACT|nr:leucine-rich repeat domain-containing protein [Chryseosolibacter histidini]MBT1699214.1 leucine-rich repeat domain-containing protein [Chryseosolibacter histidini]